MDGLHAPRGGIAHYLPHQRRWYGHIELCRVQHVALVAWTLSSPACSCACFCRGRALGGAACFSPPSPFACVGSLSRCFRSRLRLRPRRCRPLSRGLVSVRAALLLLAAAPGTLSSSSSSPSCGSSTSSESESEEEDGASANGRTASAEAAITRA